MENNVICSAYSCVVSSHHRNRDAIEKDNRVLGVCNCPDDLIQIVFYSPEVDKKSVLCDILGVSDIDYLIYGPLTNLVVGGVTATVGVMKSFKNKISVFEF